MDPKGDQMGPWKRLRWWILGLVLILALTFGAVTLISSQRNQRKPNAVKEVKHALSLIHFASAQLLESKAPFERCRTENSGVFSSRDVCYEFGEEFYRGKARLENDLLEADRVISALGWHCTPIGSSGQEPIETELPKLLAESTTGVSIGCFDRSKRLPPLTIEYAPNSAFKNAPPPISNADPDRGVLWTLHSSLHLAPDEYVFGFQVWSSYVVAGYGAE
jgi:hypothetical protein